ncbi:acyl-CoA synthetase [Geodermatophilus sp. TF02-6]|uniref:AMP-binding protein n=1 Tax=Geodermatophilus sp. TF02-6 TaxID=2250575 RepID=UPI000DEA67C4|nr:AMP-binding protein [Geodermatophilus sp. TF02-6]RBY77272.1 acyl-CoA synthetase [Geodermatophilus sp. TF02-6]
MPAEAPERPATAGRLFPDTYAAADPGRPAYVMAGTGRTVTYAELVAASRGIAALLWSRGLRHGDCAAILLGNDEHFLQVAWACQRIGLRYVAISTRMTPPEVAYVLADSGARALVTGPALLDVAAAAASASGVGTRLTTGAAQDGFEALDAAVAAAPPVEPEEREGVDLLYSSGTTGRPKGVATELTLPPLGTPPGFAGLFSQLWGIGGDSVYLSPAPLYHAAPLRVSMTVHRHGGVVVVMERFDAAAALELIERHRVTEVQMVPTMMIRMLKLPVEQRTAHDLSSLRCLVHAAAPIPVEAKREVIEWLGPIVHEYYSATENHLFTELDSAQWLAHPGSVGRPVVGTPHILDDDGNELPPGETGTIWAEGGRDFVYLNDPEKTAQARNDRGWTTVGDLGHLDEDGYLYLSDRRTDLILSGGVNVYPQETENVLLGHPAVADAAVFGIPHEEMGEVVHAVVQLRAGVEAGPELEEELLDHLRQRLADVKCPRRIDVTEQLPRTETGKLFKRLLRDRYTAQCRT